MGELAQPSRGGLSHIFIDGVPRVRYNIHVYIQITIQSNSGLIKLSLVNTTPLCTNHMKILILSDTLIFHKCKDLDSAPEFITSMYDSVPEFITSMYIDFTINLQEVVNFH